ncbi:Tat (twin-arginine translocation) pathway signal sequence [Sulfurivirga caldicuralii]|uniref:Tat (Twin-arginine translocation) pathway signal sequence n=1 Tax=Sulfurivirga caldicuralii TaxID=364032 RepID=A0A1N6DJP7_9GAMM|nr:molybdopterin-dependent oxidoreductase [Sulfurivirga caldicuralii]SIN70990.1 Tat (twin-arginine translocation) pathway signal sequence [Sulfurivirga caldicuralii]
MAWRFPKLTRRTFLKGTAAAAAATATGTASAHLPSSLEDLMFPEKKRGTLKEEFHHTICNFCSSLCNIEVRTLTDGEHSRIVKLEGNPYSTLNRGRACARGQSGVFQTYDPDRIKTPLIRVEGSKRGEWKFRKATWDEAWDYIAKKSKGIKPWEWTVVGGWTNCVYYMNWSVSFVLSNEIPNIVASPMQHCVTTGHLGTDSVTGNFNIHDEVLPDFDNAKYIMYIANNGSMGAVSTPRVVRAAEAKQRGAKIVVLDPRLSETAAKADEWVRIRPGTDLDFATAMMRTIMANDWYDAEFCKKHTNLPFLIEKDANNEWQLVKDADGYYLVYDAIRAEVRPVKPFHNRNDEDINGNRIDPALRLPKGVTHNGKPAKTVFEAQLEEVDFCTPEWAAKSTGIPAKDIERIAWEFSHIKPAIIDPGWMGARYNNIQMLRRVQAQLQALIGGIDRKGGWVNGAEVREKVMKMYEKQAKGEEIEHPLAEIGAMPFAQMVVDVFGNPNTFSHGMPDRGFAYGAMQRAKGNDDWVSLPVMTDVGLPEAVRGELEYNGRKYMAKAFLINGANPVHHYFSDNRWKDLLAHENVELVIAIDVLPADTCAYADVILPNSTYLERDEPATYGNGVNQDLGVTTRFRAIDPIYDTMEVTDILVKMSEILNGKEGVKRFIETVDKLVGLDANKAWQYYEEMVKAGSHAPWHEAYRKLSIEKTAEKHGMTPEELEKALREKGVVYFKTMDELLEEGAMPEKMPVPTGSGRLEFFSTLYESMRVNGRTRAPNFHVLAKWFPAGVEGNKQITRRLKDNEFFFTYGKSPTVSHGSTNANNPVLYAINSFKEDIYTGIWIHPDRAAKLGVKNGDRIRLVNNEDNSLQVEGNAYVTRNVQPETLFMYSSFGTENKALTRAAGFGSAINKVIGYKIDPVVGGFRSQEFTVTVEKV